MPIARYKNGNTTVTIDLTDGTRWMETEDDDFKLDFPVSIDVNIGNRCDGSCPFCYINASHDGINADLMHQFWVHTLHPYTEIAINGNSVDHPQLEAFLRQLADKRVIANMTVNQIHFERKEQLIRRLIDDGLVNGLGISLRKATPEFVAKVKTIPNAVIHTINGILTAEDLETLRDNDLKLLILGYKHLGRGVGYSEENDLLLKARQKYLYDVLPTLPDHFKVISFDNLALEQLDVRRILTDGEWAEFYQGDEGSLSMYIDLVSGKFGVSSLCSEAEMHPIMDSIEEMFKVVKKESGND